MLTNSLVRLEYLLAIYSVDWINHCVSDILSLVNVWHYGAVPLEECEPQKLKWILTEAKAVKRYLNIQHSLRKHIACHKTGRWNWANCCLMYLDPWSMHLYSWNYSSKVPLGTTISLCQMCTAVRQSHWNSNTQGISSPGWICLHFTLPHMLYISITKVLRYNKQFEYIHSVLWNEFIDKPENRIKERPLPVVQIHGLLLL